MANFKKISVVIPVFNREGVVLRAVDSVLNQTYPVHEVIVVDDCSTDNTYNLVDSVDDPRVRLICNEVNSGACRSRNVGIEAASGEYIALLDSDDEWLPEKLEKQMAALEASNADICSCRFRRIFTETSCTIEDVRELLPVTPPGLLDRESLVKESLVSTQTILAKRAVFDKCLFDPDMPRLQDYEWTIRASEYFTFYLVDESLVNVYLQDDSITSTGEIKLSAAFEMILDKHRENFAADPSLLSYLYVNAGKLRARTGRSPASCYASALKLHFNLKVAVNLLLSKVGFYR